MSSALKDRPQPVDATALAEFWQHCQAALPGENLGPSPPAPRHFGRTPELSSRLAGYVLARTKTGVFSQPEDFPGGQLPRPGDLQLVTDFSGQPRCLIRYDECQVMTFAAVGAEHTAVETPALRDLTAWRRFHRSYWEPVLAARGEVFQDDQVLVFQRFTCLYPPA